MTTVLRFGGWPKKKESIKYCARKCHNGGPLTKMMANHRKKFCGGAERTIAILSSSWRGQPASQPPPLLPPPQPAPGQPSLPSLPQSATKPERLPPLSPARIYVKHFINLGAHIMSPTILKLLLTAMTLVSVASEEVTGGLQCYIDVEAKTIVTCNELEGFKTCFIKYNDSKYIPSAFPFGVLHQYQEAAVVGRGCSTKDKVFYKECETHNYGDSLEKMCFCSFQLCNASNQLNCPSFWTLTLLVFLATAYTATTATTVTTQTFYWIIWDPWPKSWHPYATKLPAANVKKKPSPIHIQYKGCYSDQTTSQSHPMQRSSSNCSSIVPLLANEKRKILFRGKNSNKVLFSSKCHKKLPIATNLQQNNKFSDILKFKNKSELLFNEAEDDKATTNSAAPVHSVQQQSNITQQNKS